MSAQHDPEATALTCEACRDGATGFDHEAVRGRRAKDFEAQVRAHVAEIARGGASFAGVTLHPDAARRARRWLLAHPR